MLVVKGKLDGVSAALSEAPLKSNASATPWEFFREEKSIPLFWVAKPSYLLTGGCDWVNT